MAALHLGAEGYSTDGTNGKVGIGTSSPAVTLHVNAVLRLEPQSSAPSGGKGDMYIDTSGYLYVHNGSMWKRCQYV